jgi:hypothetical protein
MRLTLLGTQDIFWAPMGGWVIAAVSTLLATEKIHLLRLAWVLLDILNVALVLGITRRFFVFGPAIPSFRRGVGLPYAAALAYALYLPAIGYSVHLTGEVLSLFFLLAAVWMADWGPTFRLWRMAAAGCLFGCMTLTRPNLAPVVVLFAVFLVTVNWQARQRWRSVLLPSTLLLVMAVLPSTAWVVRNYAATGYVFLNLSYPHGFYRVALATNQDDLRFLDSSPNEFEVDNRHRNALRAEANNAELERIQASPSRNAARAVLMDGSLRLRSVTAQEVFEKRTEAILRVSAKDQKEASLWEQVRRGVSRLGRSLAPKTGIFDLVPRARPLLDPLKFSIFSVANVQWGLVLVFGIAGLLAGAGLDRRARLLLLAIVVGGLAATPFAHGEPRYSFPVEFALVIAAVGFFWEFQQSWRALLRSRWRLSLLVVALIFVEWSWVAAARWAFAGNIRGTW